MTSETPLTQAQRENLRAIAGIIIPASSEFDAPGADDPAIQADMLATLGRDAGLVRAALDELACIAGAPLANPAIQADMLATLGRDAGLVRAALDELACIAGAPLANLEPERREAAALGLRARGGPAVAALTRVVLQCYYRDDRVVRSLGLEPRPPYPAGHVLEDGDWSLLDPIRARPPFWRRA